MAVFTSPVLDNFNRGTASPPSGNWTPYSNATSNLGIDNSLAPNVCSCQGASNSTIVFADAWSPSSTWLAAEAYADIVTWSTTGGVITNLCLFLRGQNPGSASTTARAYGCIWNLQNSTSIFPTMAFALCSNSLGAGLVSGVTLHNQSSLLLLTAGDSVGFRVYDYTGPGFPGVMLEAWQRPASTGIWSRVHAYVDTSNAITSAGYIGAAWGTTTSGQRMSFDNFGGGSISAPSPRTITNTDWPILVGALPDDLGASGLAFQGAIPAHIAAQQDPLSDKVEGIAVYGADEAIATPVGGKAAIL